MRAIYLYTYDSIGNLIASEMQDAAGNCVMRAYQNYDASGQLVGQSVYLGDSNYSKSYTYNTDGALATITTGTGQTLSYTYDTLKRLTAVNGSMYTKNYTYRDLNNYYTTEQISQLQYTGLPAELTYGYTYDALGNIATYTASGKSTITYTYDNQGQLLSAVGDETYTYTYDDVGNVLTANGHTYTYGDTNWRDLLTAYDGETITYDASGNPLSYYNGTRWAFTWENGRSLATATDGTTNISYAYDANGLRTSKVVNGVTHNYLYASGQLMRETYGGNTLDSFYDANGYPYALKLNGTTYYYITNLQGDVMYLIDTNENTVASYEYDPYGNIVSATGTMAQINPLRYRGYYYDAETGLYYLQSRYYSPSMGRFINADAYIATGQGTVGNNMFAYCLNNPVNMVDFAGDYPEWAVNALTPYAETEAGYSLRKAMNQSMMSGSSRSSLPVKGAPNSSDILLNPDGTIKQKRWYDEKGNALRDRDYNHGGEENGIPFPHDHEWGNGKRGEEHLDPSPEYEFTSHPIISILIIAACSVGALGLTADDLTGVGVSDNFLFVPLLSIIAGEIGQ